jgi:transcriptional regulator with GAF, ATPase, and Fis domain
LGLLFFAQQQLDELLAQVRERGLFSSRVLMVALTDIPPPTDICWQLMEAGAADVIWWRGAPTAQHIQAKLQRWEHIEGELRSAIVRSHMVGESPAWIATLRELIEIARFGSGPCLLQGESGTGKELAARLLHTLDSRKDKGELIVVDCSTIVSELSGSEFFGHARGAYTGAVGSREGAFSLANSGTLFLDEIGELPLPLQAQLLRVIQEGTYKPVGGNEWRETSFRLICATNREIENEVRQGKFRSDLYYRIAGAVVTLPSLRERTQDVLPLVRHFMSIMLPEGSRCDLDEAVKAYLLSLDYPGNIRELRQIVTRMCRKHAGGGVLTLGDLADGNLRREVSRRSVWCDGAFEGCIRRAVFEGSSLREIGRQATDFAIKVALEEAQGNLRAAARRLGVTDRALQIRRAVQREQGDGDMRRAATTTD